MIWCIRNCMILHTMLWYVTTFVGIISVIVCYSILAYYDIHLRFVPPPPCAPLFQQAMFINRLALVHLYGKAICGSFNISDHNVITWEVYSLIREWYRGNNVDLMRVMWTTIRIYAARHPVFKLNSNRVRRQTCCVDIKGYQHIGMSAAKTTPAPYQSVKGCEPIMIIQLITIY